MSLFLKAILERRGMTLLEVMMAVAVFGIIMAFTTQMSTFSSSISGDNLNQVKMMELARAEMERIRATSTDGAPGPIAYPPGAAGAGVEQTYAITYEKSGAGFSDVTLTIIIGPATKSQPLDKNDPDNYVLVGWFPP